MLLDTISRMQNYIVIVPNWGTSKIVCRDLQILSLSLPFLSTWLRYAPRKPVVLGNRWNSVRKGDADARQWSWILSRHRLWVNLNNRWRDSDIRIWHGHQLLYLLDANLAVTAPSEDLFTIEYPIDIAEWLERKMACILWYSYLVSLQNVAFPVRRIKLKIGAEKNPNTKATINGTAPHWCEAERLVRAARSVTRPYIIDSIDMRISQ